MREKYSPTEDITGDREVQPESKTENQPLNVDSLLIKLREQEIEDVELSKTKVEFEKVYENLHELGQRIVNGYHKTCKALGRHPGNVRLYMVGGRVQGKPLKTDSDID